MICNNFFDPERDKERVVEGRSINLRSAFETGVVQSTGTEDEFNGLDEPENIGERIEDDFDAVIKQRELIAKARSQGKKELENKPSESVNPEKGEGA